MDTLYLCPILQTTMVDPVTTADGHSYERSAIEQWFAMGQRSSPVTGLPLPNTQVTPNHALRSAIQNGVPFVAQPGTAPEPVPAVDPTWNQVVTNISGNILAATVTNPHPLPVSLVLVVDVSTSMSEPCQKGSEDVERFSRLDLVKHSVKTLITVMRPTDKLTIISYESHANVVASNVMLSSDAEKKRVMRLVDNLESNGGTTLCNGLKEAYNRVSGQDDVIVVLTDGEFTQGDINNCKELIKGKTNEIHTMAYGFGSELMSGFMHWLSRETNGCYNYIPDGSMVGTTFVHMIANQMTICARRVCHNGLYLGNLHINQIKYVWVPPVMANQQPPDPKGLRVLKYNQVLSKIMSFLSYAQIEKAKQYIHSLVDEYTTNDDDAVLYQDLNYADDSKGQIMKAMVNTDTYIRWGTHYIPSFVNAHARQEKTNFKDESMRVLYETPELKTIVDNLEQIFLTMPPPKPSRDRYVSAATQRRSAGVASMMTRDTGCFTGDSIIGGVMIQDVLPGDIINGAKVKFVVRYTVEGGATICRLGGFGITPYHPVKNGGEWKFPCEIVTPRLENDVFMLYNLVLESNHSVFSTDKYYEACTLGHNFTGAKIAHPYFGTNLCVSDISKHAVNGVATFTDYEWVRDNKTKMVVAMKVN